MDLKDRFELATSGGPAHGQVGDDLARGRRARRRRTAGLAALSTAAVVALAPVTVAIADGRTADPTTAGSNPTPPPPEGYEWGTDELARMTVQGDVVVRPGVTVNERLEDPVADRTSVALDVTWRGTRHHVLLYRTLSGVTTSLSAPAGGTPLGA